jgi:hypothetical protein
MLSVKVLMAGYGWQAGRVLSTGAVLIDRTGEVVPPGRIRQVVHYPRREAGSLNGQAPTSVPRESPPPEALGWLVLLGTILYEGRRAEFEADAWPWWKAKANGVLQTAVATLSAVPALVVSATNGFPALAATAASGE